MRSTGVSRHRLDQRRADTGASGLHHRRNRRQGPAGDRRVWLWLPDFDDLERPGRTIRHPSRDLGTLLQFIVSPDSGGVFGITIAIFLTQDFLPSRLAVVFRTIIELLAAIPSVVFGLWGIYVLIPCCDQRQTGCTKNSAWCPFRYLAQWSRFGSRRPGLAIMIPPTVASISVDAACQIPYKVKGSRLWHGHDPLEAILRSCCPPPVPASSPRWCSVSVAPWARPWPGHADRQFNQISLSLFAPANTLAALLASNFPGGRRNRGSGPDVRGPWRCWPSPWSSTSWAWRR